MSKTVTLRLGDEFLKKLKLFASAENRSLSNFLQTAALHYLEESEFVSSYELAEINNNKDLVQRIKQGSKDARNRQGRFIK